MHDPENIYLQPLDLKTLFLFQSLCRPGHRRMFHARRQNAPRANRLSPCPRYAAQGQIIGFATTGGKYDLMGMGSSQPSRQADCPGSRSRPRRACALDRVAGPSRRIALDCAAGV
jgi:hypothetical protein